jgi:hypothetical protein
MKLKLLYLAQNSIESKIIQDELKAINIDSNIRGNNLQSILGGVPIDAMYCKIYVNEEDYSTAKKFIDKYKENIKKTENEMWDCNNCQEKCPTTIHTCWNCNTPKELDK